MAVANPFDIAKPIFFKLEDFFANAITDGPAPLIVTPNAPAFRAFSLTLGNPGIKCCLAGSTITSLIEFPINSESLFINPATIPDAFDKFKTLSVNLIFLGITPLDTLVFFFGTLIFGTAIHILRFVGGSILIISSGLVFTITNPPNTDAATLS